MAPAPDVLLRPFRPGTSGLSAPEVDVLVAEGVLRHLVGDVVASASLTDDVLLRGAAAALLTPPGAVVVEQAAAWLHGLWPSTAHRGPARLTLLHRSPRRLRAGGWPAVPMRVRDGRISPRDVVLLGGVAVSTTRRTCADVARWEDDETAAVLLPRLLEQVSAQLVLDDLDAAKGGRNVALGRARVLAQRGEDVAAASSLARAPVIRYTSNTPSTRRTAPST